MRILGLDPGVTGALALLDTELSVLAIADMPSVVVTIGKKTQRRTLSETWLAETIHQYEPDAAWLERVHALPGQGVTSSFSFGLAYGMARGALAAARVPLHLVTPQEWKRHFRLGASKNAARLIAARLFPHQSGLFARVKDDGRAEAALLALFGAQSLKEYPSVVGL